MLRSTSLLLASALLGGCAVGPNYQQPRETVAATFQSAQENLFSDAAPETNWWANFRDPALNALIVDALKRNHSLRIAQASLAEARAARRHALLAFAPTGAANGSVLRGRPSEIEAARMSPSLTETWSTGFDASWEIDVFGRTRRRAEAASAEVGMADATLRDVQVALLGEVAANYFALRNTEQAIRLVDGQLATLRESHALTERRVAAGRGTELDTARTEALLRETESLRPSLEHTAAEHRHRLAVLTGTTPGDLSLAATNVSPAHDQPVRIGQPADLLRRRPDIQRAERALAAATAHIGVRTAAFFPEVSVQGFLGFVGLSRDQIGDAGSQSWTVAPSIRWRLLDYGRLHAQLTASRARKDGVLATYEQTVLRALEETENAFVRYGAAVARTESLVARQRAAERARDLAVNQYEAGGADPLARLDAERTALAAARDVIAAETERNLAIVAVYKALGGGWEIASPESIAAR
jgi:multidrug efflux system outer membrane protein